MKKERFSPEFLICTTKRLHESEKLYATSICIKEAKENGNKFYTTQKFRSFKKFCIYMLVNCKRDEYRAFFYQTLRVAYGSKFDLKPKLQFKEISVSELQEGTYFKKSDNAKKLHYAHMIHNVQLSDLIDFRLVIQENGKRMVLNKNLTVLILV